MKSYRPEDLFDEMGRLVPELAALAPRGDRRMSANPHANGGLLLKELRLPDFRDYAVEVTRPGAETAESTRLQGRYLRDVMRLNLEQRNFRLQIIPVLIVAPLFIRGEAEFGVIPQSSMAFNSLARALLARPRFAVLDRPALVLGPEQVAHALTLLAAASITAVTFASDPALGALHDAGSISSKRPLDVDPAARGESQRMSSTGLRLASPSGVAVQVNANGSIRRIDHQDVIVNGLRRVPACHVGSRASHGHAEVGLPQGGRVVHSVAGDGDQRAPTLPRLHDAKLVGGRRPRDDAALGDPVCERVVVEPGELGAREHRRAGRGQSDASGDGPGGRRVIPGDHDDADARGAAGGERVGYPARGGSVMATRPRKVSPAGSGAGDPGSRASDRRPSAIARTR
jgi:hypothetical protein